MGRPPGNGGPAFRFMANEVMEMEGILQQHHNTMPPREILEALAEKFSESPGRKGKIAVQMKQVWNWFQNRRYSVRAKTTKSLVKLNVTTMPQESPTPATSMPHPVVPQYVTSSMPARSPALSVPNTARSASENSYMEFEAKSARDGAWYDVGTFLSHRYLDTGDPEVLVRFAGFGLEEDEWLNICKNVRQRSLPCEASECVAVLPGDLILCFQEGKDQALYFDAHVLDAQRRRHDVRGCRCRFLVRYDHDQSEEIVPLRKVCRRPETDYRLQQLHAANGLAVKDQQKASVNLSAVGAQKVAVSAAETTPKKSYPNVTMLVPPSQANILVAAKTTTPELKNANTNSHLNAGNPSVSAPASTSGATPGSSTAGAGEYMQGSK